MTATEVLDALATRFPSRTIVISETCYYHGSSVGRYIEHVISIQPGLDGLDNQNFGGNSLQEALVKFNLAAMNYGK